MKNIIIVVAVLFGISNLYAQTFNRDSCHLYFINNQELKLSNYLERTYDKLKTKDRVHYYYYKAIVCRKQKNLSCILESIISGKKLTEGDRDSMRWKFLDELALTYRREGSGTTAKGMAYINESLSLKLRYGALPNDLARSYIVKGNLWYSSDHIESNLDSTIYYYQLAQKLNTRKLRSVLLARNIATASMRNEEIDSVDIRLLRVIDFYNKNDQTRKSLATSVVLSGFYTMIDSFSKADLLLDSIYSLSLINPNWKKERRDIFRMLIYSANEQESWKEVASWRDSLNRLEKELYATRLDDQVTKFDLENKLALEQAKVYKNRFWLSILLGTTGTLCLILFGLYKYLGLRRKAAEKELEHTRTKAAYDTTRAKMEGEQQERESIASVLHDQVASLLTAADMHLKVAQKDEPELRGLKEAGSIIKDINEQVRDLSHQLVSPTLTKFGLEAGIDTLTDRMETADVEINYASNLGPLRFDSSIETFVFQSCAELIQNVLKHSSADVALVQLALKEGSLVLKVIDNGDNSEVDKAAPTGLGLTHIYNRAAAIAGEFTFELMDKGAKSVLKIPVTPLEN